jgi:hypothetical protein
MPIDQTQPSRSNRSPQKDHLAETDKHLARTQASRGGETRQSQVRNPAPESPNGGRRKIGKLGRMLLLLFGFFGGLVLLAAISGGAGYYTSSREGSAQATLEMGVYLMNQYELAVKDYGNGNYQLAFDRLVYIVSKDPEFTAAADLLLQVHVILNKTATPQPPTATVTLTPTPDLRPAEEQYNTAVVLITQHAWDLALESLSNLRKVHPDYRIIDVDGLMYLALRNRGIAKILNRELEGGIYDLTLAEKFGPLDNEANNYWGWARLYLLGNAFWGAYPEQAAYYYGQLVGTGVDIRDSSGESAFYRYVISLAQIGDLSAAEGDWCLASEQYQAAVDSWALDHLVPTATHAFEQCLALTPSITPTATITETPTITLTPEGSLPPVGGTPTSTPSPTITPTNTPGGTVNTNTPTATQTATPTFTPTNTQGTSP